jgi:hypothetical protein
MNGSGCEWCFWTGRQEYNEGPCRHCSEPDDFDEEAATCTCGTTGRHGCPCH